MTTAEARAGVTERHPLADAPGGLLGLPNQITLVRTVLAMAAAAVVFETGGWRGLVVGYLVYWAGDSLDGNVARWTKQETKVGAVFDLVSDRACTFLLAGAFIAAYPAVLWPLALYLFQFGVLDTMLSLAFLLWPAVISPNHFYRIDKTIWRWNWWIPAKVLNSTAVVLALVLSLRIDAMWPAFVVVGIASVVKVASAVRILQILTGRVAARPVT